jgi:hypothetical protein
MQRRIAPEGQRAIAADREHIADGRIDVGVLRVRLDAESIQRLTEAPACRRRTFRHNLQLGVEPPEAIGCAGDRFDR